MNKIAFISTMSGFDSSVPRWAGCEELWGQTALHLRRAGMEVGVNVFRWPEPVRQIEELVEAGCTVQKRWIARGLARVLPDVARRLPCRWLEGYQPNLVVITQHQYQVGLEWVEKCRELKIPYVLIVQAADDRFVPTQQEISDLGRAFEEANATFFVSQHNQHLVERQLRVALKNSSIVRNPFKVRHCPTLEWPSQNDGVKIACVGRLDLAKGQDILFKVLEQRKWRDRNLQVTLFGNGPLRDQLIAAKQEHNLTKIVFGGFEKNVEDIWRTHHALVLPSRVEGLPLAIVEALLCGRPCIATDVAGNGELIRDNVTGFIAAEAEAGSLDEAMERAWKMQAEWHQMGDLAASCTREAIPADPVGMFASQLNILIHSLQSTVNK